MPQAPIQLVCLPSAGSGASMFRSWPAVFGADADILVVQPPGRENRGTEPAAADLTMLARRIAVHLVATLDRPYAIFGHSMGALLAYELAAIMPALERPPLFTVMSAVRPPNLPRPGHRVAEMDDTALLAHLDELGGLAPEILEHDDLMALLLPTIRTDLYAVDAFRPEPDGVDRGRIVLVAADGDTHAPAEVVAGWRSYVGAGTALHTLPGNHFYLNKLENLSALHDLILSPDRGALAMTDTFQLEPYRQDDADRAAMEVLNEARTPGEPAVHREPFEGQPMRTMAVRDGDELLGYSDCGVVGPIEDPDSFHVWIIVHPRVARRGIATALLLDAVEFADEHKVNSLITGVDRDDTIARDWLLSRGFHRVGQMDFRSRKPIPAELPPYETKVDVLPAAVAAQNPALIALATAELSRRPMPGDAFYLYSDEEISTYFIGPYADSTVLVAGDHDCPSGLAFVRPATGDDREVGSVCVAADAPSDTVAALMAAAAELGERERASLEVLVSPELNPALDDATAGLGFESSGGRHFWRLTWPAGTRGADAIRRTA
jgi:surfactin synthase thioesterase subunit/GNAT superfamily N-acetyltransferase